MDVKNFYFDLSEELVTQGPLKDRSSSRLLVPNKDTEETRHRVFRSTVEYLGSGDCLVINDTGMTPVRLFGTKKDTGARIEILLLKCRENNIWETLVRPGKKARLDTVIDFGEGLLTDTVIDTADDGDRLTRFNYKGIFEEILDQLGQISLPSYITHQLQNKNRYQTVYARYEGSVVTPTAGLHFARELLRQIEDVGVKIVHVTPHMGLGTFRPVKAENVLNHRMHSEFYVVGESEVRKVDDTKAAGGRVICVGTTSCRTVESVSTQEGILGAKTGWMEALVYPGYRFEMLDALITNFHLPESTLVMLVNILAGREHILNAYQEAVKKRYRFFSFRDAMFIASGPKTGNQQLQRI